MISATEISLGAVRRDGVSVEPDVETSEDGSVEPVGNGRVCRTSGRFGLVYFGGLG